MWETQKEMKNDSAFSDLMYGILFHHFYQLTSMKCIDVLMFRCSGPGRMFCYIVSLFALSILNHWLCLTLKNFNFIFHTPFSVRRSPFSTVEFRNSELFRSILYLMMLPHCLCTRFLFVTVHSSISIRVQTYIWCYVCTHNRRWTTNDWH